MQPTYIPATRQPWPDLINAPVSYLCICQITLGTDIANIQTLLFWFSATYYNHCHSWVLIAMRQDSMLQTVGWVIHSFISGMHHYECVVPNIDIILQSGRFWATSTAAFRVKFNDSRCCWVVFIHVVRGRPGGLPQVSKGEAVKICLASDSSSIRTMWPNTKRRH